jgi:transposase-like protein
MEKTHKTLPTTLLEATRYFADLDIATRFVARLRWPKGAVCPECGGKEHSYLSTRRLWKCKSCRKQFSVKVGTIFEDSPIPLDKWLVAIWMIANSRNGVSSHELARSVGLTQKSAWFVLHRVRLAMQTGTFVKAAGHVEVDETFIGGKARNMHVKERKRKIKGTGGKNKAKVMGVLERGGKVQVNVVPDVRKRTVQTEVRNRVEPGSNVYSDALHSYTGLATDYAHKVVDHADAYVNGQVHTNGLENFWSLLKRGLGGTYISVQPYHLFRYLDEQVYRYNHREMPDGARFQTVLSNVVDRRLTYREVTGKDLVYGRGDGL